MIIYDAFISYTYYKFLFSLPLKCKDWIETNL